MMARARGPGDGAVWFDQSAYDVRVEWGGGGVASLCDGAEVVVIVDVLSFSTCVDVAVGRGAAILPFARSGDEARAYARQMGAQCGGPRGEGRFSLSPTSFAEIGAGERVVLPSPNGGALSLHTGGTPTFTACLRNASAVALAAQEVGRRIAVIAAGERWKSDALRPALEDWLGAGAVVAALEGSRSPEADGALAMFEASARRLPDILIGCASGRQLVDLGFTDDVVWASALNMSACAPILRAGAFVDAGTGRMAGT